MTIVCATRFTEESSFAAWVAAEIARKHKQTLWLVHVVASRVIPAWGVRFEATADAALEAEAISLRQSGVDVQTAVLKGRLEDAVSRFCASKQASLLVVGDTTRDVSAAMAGTLDKIAYAATTPLLVVRDPRPFQAWVAGKAPLKVMLALDHTSSSAVARDWILRFAKFGDLDLVAAQIWWPREEYERRGLPFPAPEEGHRALATTMETELRAALANLPANVKVRTHLEAGAQQIGEELLEIANEEQVDVVVLGTHRPRALGRLWSVSHHVLSLAPMSVACIPAAVAVPDLTAVKSFGTALAATDFSEAGNRAITVGLAAVGDGTLHVVHVSPEPLNQDAQTVLLKRLVQVLPPEAERRAKVLVHVLEGEVGLQLTLAASRLGADLLCVGTEHETVGKTSVGAHLLAYAGKPVLFAPPVKA